MEIATWPEDKSAQDPNIDTRWQWRAAFPAWETNIRDSEEWNAMTPEQQAARIAGTDRAEDTP